MNSKCDATALTCARSGVVGVSYIEYDERQVDIEAPIVVLACYAFENTRLLLVSGINGNGHVGQHLSMHNYGWFTGGEWTNPFMGSLQAGSVVDDLTSERIPDNDEGVLWGSARSRRPGARILSRLVPAARSATSARTPTTSPASSPVWSSTHCRPISTPRAGPAAR
jgi:hypothetical protein